MFTDKETPTRTINLAKEFRAAILQPAFDLAWRAFHKFTLIEPSSYEIQLRISSIGMQLGDCAQQINIWEFRKPDDISIRIATHQVAWAPQDKALARKLEYLKRNHKICEEIIAIYEDLAPGLRRQSNIMSNFCREWCYPVRDTKTLLKLKKEDEEIEKEKIPKRKKIALLNAEYLAKRKELDAFSSEPPAHPQLLNIRTL